MIIEYPMIGFLAMRYFFCARAECANDKQAFSGYALIIIEIATHGYPWSSLYML